MEEGEELVAEVHESWAPYARTAAWILREKAKGKSSEWAPYLNILPEHVPSTMFISNEALKLFEDQRLYSYVSSSTDSQIMLLCGAHYLNVTAFSLPKQACWTGVLHTSPGTTQGTL